MSCSRTLHSASSEARTSNPIPQVKNVNTYSKCSKISNTFLWHCAKCGLEWNGMDKMDWIRMEWNGMKYSGMEWARNKNIGAF